MEFGPEIKVDGKRPEWLKDGDVWQWRIALDPHFENGIAPSEYEKARTFGFIEAIRLPANHPHYTTPTPDERAVAPELVERMEALVRRMAGTEAFSCTGWAIDARAIVAALEPVDPVEAIVDELMDSDQAIRVVVREAVLRGRQLEKEGK